MIIGGITYLFWNGCKRTKQPRDLFVNLEKVETQTHQQAFIIAFRITSYYQN